MISFLSSDRSKPVAIWLFVVAAMVLAVLKLPHYVDVARFDILPTHQATATGAQKQAIEEEVEHSPGCWARQLIVAKNRNGPTSDINLLFNGGLTRFEALAKDHPPQ